jgi:hypothetical protein
MTCGAASVRQAICAKTGGERLRPFHRMLTYTLATGKTGILVFLFAEPPCFKNRVQNRVKSGIAGYEVGEDSAFR